MKRWDADDILNQLRSCSAQVNSSYNDGFTAWACKKDLLRIKYALDEMLESSPNFSEVEASFHEDMAKQKTWKKIKCLKFNPKTLAEDIFM